jgi:hypothetical protein
MPPERIRVCPLGIFILPIEVAAPKGIINGILIGSDKGPNVELVKTPVKPTEQGKGSPVLIAGSPFDIGKGNLDSLGCLNMGTGGRPISHILTGPPVSNVNINGRPDMMPIAPPLPNERDNKRQGTALHSKGAEIMNPSSVPFPQHGNSLRLTKPNIAEVPNDVK